MTWCQMLKMKDAGSSLQGSNAHVVMEVSSSTASASVTALPDQIWQRDRHWFCPAAHALLTYCSRSSARASRVLFTCLPSHPALAYLQDHTRQGLQSVPAAVCIQVGYL